MIPCIFYNSKTNYRYGKCKEATNIKCTLWFTYAKNHKILPRHRTYVQIQDTYKIYYTTSLVEKKNKLTQMILENLVRERGQKEDRRRKNKCEVRECRVYVRICVRPCVTCSYAILEIASRWATASAISGAVTTEARGRWITYDERDSLKAQGNTGYSGRRNRNPSRCRQAKHVYRRSA